MIISIIITLILLLILFSLIFHKIKSFNRLIGLLPLNASQEIQNGPDLDTKIPDFKLISGKGKLRLEEILNKPTVILIAGSGCKECKVDIQQFIQISQEYQNYNFVLIIDKTSITDVANQNYITLLSTNEFLQEYNIKLFPTFLFVGMDRMLLAKPQVVYQFQYIFKEYEKNKVMLANQM